MVEGEPLEDHRQRIGLAFSGLWGKNTRAVIAIPKLNGLIFFPALAFFDDVFTRAVWTAFDLGADEALGRTG